MLGSLTKLADKAFIIGFVLPTLLVSLTFLYLFNDVEPLKSAYVAALSIKKFDELTIALVIMWTLACLLMIWNDWQYRFLEGYVGPFNNSCWRQKMRASMVSEQADLKEQAPVLEDPNASIEEKLSHLKARREFFKRYPVRPSLVLPTRFGNIIRAFETYSYDMYGVEAIPAWLRLQAVIPKGYTALVNDARSAVDFFVNVSFFGAGVAALALSRSLWWLYLQHGIAVSAYAELAKYVAMAGVGAVVAWISYLCALPTAMNWGDAVKGAFDLYLPALAKQMGYQLPLPNDARRQFWDEVNSLFLYRQPLDATRWSAAESTGATTDRGKDSDPPESEGGSDDNLEDQDEA